MYFLYILKCKDGSLYTGITTDVTRRLKEHKAGKGGHYTRSHGAREIVYTEAHPSRSSASKREAEVKTWRREEKQKLVASKKRKEQ